MLQLCRSDWSGLDRSPGYFNVDLRALTHLRSARLDAHGAFADVTRSHLAPSCRRCVSALRPDPTLTQGEFLADVTADVSYRNTPVIPR